MVDFFFFFLSKIEQEEKKRTREGTFPGEQYVRLNSADCKLLKGAFLLLLFFF